MYTIDVTEQKERVKRSKTKTNTKDKIREQIMKEESQPPSTLSFKAQITFGLIKKRTGGATKELDVKRIVKGIKEGEKWHYGKISTLEWCVK